MQTLNLTGVILAAGKGSRMAPFSESFPKPMLPICNKPLIQHQVEIMRSLGIVEIVVLVGHKGFEISRALGSGESLGVSIKYVEQTSFLGIAHAVGCMERHIHSPFLLFLGDIFFHRGKLHEMLESFALNPGGAVLAVKEEHDPAAMRKNFAVIVGDNELVTRVIEKPRLAPSRLKGVGVYMFDLTIFDAIRNTPRTAMRDEYEITHSIQVLINDGYPVRTALAIDDDVNLTEPIDLLRCNLNQAKLMKCSALVGRHTDIHPGAQVVDSIIGDHVRIDCPIRLTRSLVFSGTHITTPADLDMHILTPDGMVDCSGAEGFPT